MKANKILLTAIAPIGLTCVSPLMSCSLPKTKDVISHETKYYKTPSVASTVYVIDPFNISTITTNKDQWYVTLQSLEGILAQTQAQIFVKSKDNNRNQWLDAMKQEMGFKTVEVTDHKVLLQAFGYLLDWKYVVYQDNTTTEESKDYSFQINNATTIAAAKKVLMVEEKLVDDIKALGFEQAYDASKYSSAKLFETFRNDLNRTMIVNQNPTNMALRDYAIASKSICTYLEWVKKPKKDHGEEDEETFNRILLWTNDNCPILGWVDDEVSFVADISQYAKVVIASDHCANLSFFSAYNPNTVYKQKHLSKIKAEQGKHYVAIVMSDGDNIQWLQSDFTTSENYYGSSYRGDFPITWTMSPTPFDVNGSVLDKIYSTQKDNDNFICGPSGYGYVNYESYSRSAEFADITAKYMQDTDMTICNFIDFCTGEEKKPEIFETPMKQKQIEGGIWSFGKWYIEGQGGVHWVNDKPIVCAREALWEVEEEHVKWPEEKQFMNIKNVADRINSYPTDPTDINGYTVILCHAWSFGKMPSINEFRQKLDSHVQLVTAEQLIDLVATNVPHEDVTATDKNAWKSQPS